MDLLIGSNTGFTESSHQLLSKNGAPKAILVQFDDIKN